MRFDDDPPLMIGIAAVAFLITFGMAYTALFNLHF